MSKYPLFPFRMDSAEWASAWLLATIGDYYATAFCLCGIVFATEGFLSGGDVVPGNLAAWLMGLMRIHGLQMLRAPLASTVFKQEARLRQAEESQLPLLPLALLQEDPFSLFSPGQ
eukprot:CAMPEP_0172671354 /NCGR_PEP_ID=MMETSP1074-20121228/10865_1 /TAXON_ID=2916 /ORGANISM="Ceratium fusus, Strain PA161109" /LENGTH=115 /DNA_ID=CAMNT_0013488385 /DNA_START=157 /DNA_END=503 /DNA_ORIENTATION=+